MRCSVQSSELALFLSHTAATKGSNLTILKKSTKPTHPACMLQWLKHSVIQTMLITVEINTHTVLLTSLSVEMH